MPELDIPHLRELQDEAIEEFLNATNRADRYIWAKRVQALSSVLRLTSDRRG